MTRLLTLDQLADALQVTKRTATRYVKKGCPSSEDGQLFNEAEVRAWCAQEGLRLLPPPATSAPSVAQPAGAAAPPVASRASLQTAELARRLTIARKNELELAAEKGLKDLGLGERIRAAKTHADLLEFTKQVIELVGEGSMSPVRARSLQGLLAQAARQLKASRETDSDGETERLILTTEEGGELVEAFEGIVSDERRAECTAFVLDAAARDLEENPNVDLAEHLAEDPDEVALADVSAAEDAS